MGMGLIFLKNYNGYADKDYRYLSIWIKKIRNRKIKMIVICFTEYPVQRSMEVTMRYLELPRLPEYITGKGNYVYSANGKGYHSISIFKVDDKKVKKAFDAITKACLTFIDIPGYQYEIRICHTANEGIKLLA